VGSRSDDGTKHASQRGRVAYCVEELLVYQKSQSAADAISAVTNRLEFGRDPELRRQLRGASGRIPSHIAEGFGQKTDRHFAHYLYIARGTAKEIRAHLAVAKGRSYITEAERLMHWETYDEIARMLTGLIRHLERDDRKNRG
jgi:four helix bundle protein